MKLRRVLAILLALIMILSCAACGKKETANEEKKEDAKWPYGQTITVLEGYATGSLTDVGVRTQTDWITDKTGVTVEVVNDDVGGGANLITRLVDAEPDGLTIMQVGMNCISNYHNGIWSVNIADESKVKICCFAIQPYPYSGCMVMTQPDAPYDTWEEFVDYVKAHPGEEKVASIAGKVMDIKLKAIMNLTDTSQYIRWVSTTNADATAGLLGNNIDIIMLDEATASNFIAEGTAKPLINLRDKDFSYFPADTKNFDIIKSVPTLIDVFGEDGMKYMVPNTSAWIVPADTPDEVCQQIADLMATLDSEPAPGSEWYQRVRTTGGTSKYYVLDPAKTMQDWKNIDPIIKGIVDMGK